MSRHLHWFRNDLRLFDNPALHAAAQAGVESQGVIACYVMCPEQWRRHDMAPIQADFIRRNLESLSADLAQRRIPLLIVSCQRVDEVPPILLRLMQKHNCTALHFNDEPPVNERKRDAGVTRLLRQHGYQVNRYQDQAIIPPGQLKTKAGTAYTVFTPFRRAWQVHFEQHWPALWTAPSAQAEFPCKSSSVPRELLGFDTLPSDRWPAGEKPAQETLDAFVHGGLLHYKSRRDFPALSGTSKLSPYLALGVLSPRQTVLTAYNARHEYPNRNEEIESWIQELIWRDFYIHILDAFPRVSRHKPFKEDTDAVPWRTDDQDFRAWCEGRTGIPIVDAAMRQLNQTGWMHNRLRMITAMFLSKNLLIDWRRGERYFMRNLIDGFLAANNGGWQWSASTGTDSAPYFRIFNPVTQGQKFDPKGKFILTYLPELKARPLKLLHQPLTDEEVRLGLYDYPPPILDLKESRERVLMAFRGARDTPARGSSID